MEFPSGMQYMHIIDMQKSKKVGKGRVSTPYKMWDTYTKGICLSFQLSQNTHSFYFILNYTLS